MRVTFCWWWQSWQKQYKWRVVFNTHYTALSLYLSYTVTVIFPSFSFPVSLHISPLNYITNTGRIKESPENTNNFWYVSVKTNLTISFHPFPTDDQQRDGLSVSTQDMLVFLFKSCPLISLYCYMTLVYYKMWLPIFPLSLFLLLVSQLDRQLTALMNIRCRSKVQSFLYL